MRSSDAGAGWTRHAEVALGTLLTLGLVPLYLEYYRHAGALWRDEINSINVAAMPSMGAVYAHSHYDSFPIAWVTLLHGWLGAGLGESDASIRTVGLLVGLGVVGILWWAARRLGVTAPLVTLLLLAMSPSMIVYGSQVRGYGLGVLALLWSAAATWTFVQQPTGRRFAIAQLAAILTVQTYYANAFLLLAASAGGAAVCARRRAWRSLVAIGVIGAVAASSLLLNLPGMLYAARVSEIEIENPGLAWRIEVFRHALAPDVPPLAIAWAAAAILALAGCALAVRPAAARRPGGGDDVDRALFVGATALTATAGFVWYLQYLARVPTQYWYYLSLMAVFALACEIGVDVLARRHRYARWARLAAVATIALLAAPAVAANVPVRMTNVDLIAGVVEENATDGDLIVVLPWYCGVTFDRYYRGDVPWITLPDLDDHRFHEHALVKERMTRGADAITRELGLVERTLRDGGTVWIVGAPLPPPADGAIPSLVPAPTGPDGWHVGPYLEGWAMQLGALLQEHAGKVGRIDVPKPGRINRWEHLPLYAAAEWR